MIIYKNRLVFGIIRKIITGVLKAVYGVISLFNLQATALVALIGIVLYATGILSANNTVLIVFCLALVFSVMFAVVTTVRKLLGISGDRKKRKGVEIMPTDDRAAGEKTDNKYFSKVYGDYAYAGGASASPPTAPERADAMYSAVTPSPAVNEPPAPTNVYPKYFAVKQNNDYIMAEYEDRYELYLKDRYGLTKVRTDYKNGENAQW